MSGDQSRLRTTLIGSLLDVARRNRAHGAGDAGAVRGGRGVPAGRRRARCRASRTTSAALLIGPGAPGDLARARAAQPRTSSPSRASSPACSTTLRVAWSVRAGASEPFLHPGRAATVARRRRAGRLARRDPSAGRRANGSSTDTVAAFELDLDAVAGDAADATAYEDLTSFPEVREDLAVVVSEQVDGRARCSTVVKRAGGAAARARRGVRRLPRPRAARGGQRVARAAARVPRARPDADRRGGRGQAPATITAALASELGGGSVPRSVGRVFGAAGFTGALTARLLYRHPSFELRALTARSRRRPPARRPVPAPPRPADARGARPRPPRRTSTRRWSPTRTAPPRELVAALRERGVRVVDLSADFRLRDPAVYERVVPRASRAGAARRGRVRAARAATATQIRGADLVANPGCYPTAALLALGPLARAGLIERRRDRRQVGRLRRRAAPRPTRPTSSTVDENVNAYGVPRHRHTPEIEQELAATRAPRRHGSPSRPHLLPLDQGELVSCYVTSSGRLDDVRSRRGCIADAYAAEPFVELRRDAARGPRRARDEHLPDLGPPRRSAPAA